jgi:hypothetical protein
MHALDTLSAFVRGAAIGAAAMYMLDPDKGRRRRAIARDKLTSFANDSGEVLSAAAHDITNRLRGVQATAYRAMHAEGTPDDLRLIERVRARIGRAVSNPHAIKVGAREGRIMLSGPVLASEVRELVAAARSVAGVADVEEHLIVHREPGSIPSLQGTPRPRDPGAGLLDGDAPVVRAAAIVAGLALAAFGATRGSLSGVALAALGAGIASRGARHPAEQGGRTAVDDAPGGERRSADERSEHGLTA